MQLEFLTQALMHNYNIKNNGEGREIEVQIVFLKTEEKSHRKKRRTRQEK